MVTAGPPPLTILQPGEGAVGDLGTIGVAFKFGGGTLTARFRLWNTRSLSALSFRPTSTHAKTNTRSSRGRNRLSIWRS